MSFVGKSTIRESSRNRYKRFSKLRESPKAKVSGLVSLTVFTVAFFGVFAIMPTFKTIASLNKEIDDAQLVNAKLSKKIVSLERAEETWIEVSSQVTGLSSILPREHEFERLAWQVAWMADDKGVIIINESFEEFVILGKNVSRSKDEFVLPMEMSISGGYEEIKGFLEGLVSLDRLVSIEEVVINSRKLRSEEGVLSANIKATAYYFPVVEEL